MFDRNQPHRRFNPLTGEWVLVSPQRTARPWQGQLETISPHVPPAYDPKCYLCPGNPRASGERNPLYQATFVFDNDFPALLPNTPFASNDEKGLIMAQGEPGLCRVVCFSPRHDLTLAKMSMIELRQVVDAWTSQYVELGAMPLISWVQIFENRGAMMGSSNPHPHCQVWATRTAPNELARESATQLAHWNKIGSCLLCDYLKLELESTERLVCENEHFLALVPFWAVWPFEIMVLNKRHAAALDELTSEERNQLADILKEVTARYDNLFQTSFPYSMGFHQQPTDNAVHSEWHLHAHFYPPLLSSATVRKFMVGYELLATPQRDIQPEEAALRLRSA